MSIGIGLGGSGGGGGSTTATVVGDLEFVTTTNSSGTLANGARYVPLNNGSVDTMTFQFVAPSTATFDVQVSYSMSAANAGDIEMRLDYIAIGAGEDPAGTLATGTEFVVAPGNDTNVHLLNVDSSANMGVVATAGDLVICTLTRTNDAADTHTGDMRVYRVRYEEV